MKTIACILLLGAVLSFSAASKPVEAPALAQLTPGHTAAQNALWIENPLTQQFRTSNRVVVAEIQGPAMITMMHFACGERAVSPAHQLLNRDLLLRIYWDGERSPGVECPLVDFFCDPAGARDVVNTAFVNVRRGFNAYFPMPFGKSAKVELVYDGPLPPGEELWRLMPCYSYVMYRTMDKIPAGAGYFHASWRQQTLKLGLADYIALEAKGKGKLIGWNVTVRWPGREDYPVDENEKFYIDGETNASVEFQGLEDSFGFSWGFPESENSFPMTGYFPFFKGAAAYRFFEQDAISFDKSLKVAIGFGQHEEPRFREQFSQFGSSLEFSSTVYWYQTEPHAPLPPMPSAAGREPAPEQAYWPEKETLPSAADFQARGVKLAMYCGHAGRELIHAAPGYSAEARDGSAWDGWAGKVHYARADEKSVSVHLMVPKGASGLVRVYIIDPDKFEGGRKEKVTIAGESFGPFDNFHYGRWVESRVGAAQTANGEVDVSAINARSGADAVLSIIEWVGN